MDSAADTLFAGVYEKLQEKGITLDVAGGNEFQAGYGNKSGKNLPYASDPDSSTLGEPGSFALWSRSRPLRTRGTGQTATTRCPISARGACLLTCASSLR